MATLIRSAALTKFFDIAREVGLPPQAALQKAGLTKALLDNPDQRIPSRSALVLLETAAALSGCQSFGLRMAQARQLADFGVVSLLISHQPTLRAALATTVQYRHLLNESLAMQIEEVGPTAIVRQEIVAGIHSRQATELAIGVLFRLCSNLLTDGWRPNSVNFTHSPPDDLTLHRRFFDCRLEFGSEFNGFVFNARDLDAPRASAVPAMAEYARRFLEFLPRIETNTPVDEVRKAIYLLVPMGRANIQHVAQSLGLSVRSLQRQLDSEHTSFSTLLHEVRSELAQRYLRNPHYSLTRISELLGYSTPSAFTRWFHTSFGLAPITWRRQPPTSKGVLCAAPRRDAATKLGAEPMRKGTGARKT